MPNFADALIAWQRRHGRKDLPWQGDRDPYRVWLSEIMLQQTQVSAAIPYYRRFLERFPTVQALAGADEEEVLRLWSGLGYYARARNLHAAARLVASEHRGRFPSNVNALERLPGVGRSTAAAVAAFAFGVRAAILDGNVKRVLARAFGVEGYPGAAQVQARLWTLAERLLPARDIETYTQALMDLGATVCVRANPRCDACPVRQACVARRTGRTSELPAARPRRTLPQRAVHWLVLRRAGEVLLERRPAPGIWGGLWSFPEHDGSALARHCLRAFGARVGKARRLPAFEHGFTHFRLRIQPVLLDVRSLAADHSPGRLWLAPADAASAAVPAPAKRLLERLAA